MTKLSRAPTPDQFAKAWTSEFAKEVKQAAGKDGRLTLSEAKKLAESHSVMGDNAVNYLESKGQRSVDAEKLISAGYSYARAVGEKAAGPDNRISFEDSRKLTKDLVADYYLLRGRKVDGVSGTGGAGNLKELAEKFVTANAGGGYEPDAGKIFPGVDSGEAGLRGTVLQGADATRIIDLTKAWWGGDSKVQGFTFDPSKHAVVAVSDSNDEESLYVAIMDKATGKGFALGSSMNLVDIPYSINQAQFDSLVPGMGDMNEVDHYDVMNKLMELGTGLGI